MEATTIFEIQSEIRQSQLLSPLEHHLSRVEQSALGKKIRDVCPRTSNNIWKEGGERQNPVSLIEKSNEGRIQELVPLRHSRMAVSPFTFYRGSAGIMAADLATLPHTGYRLQCCGDAHLCNFGGFATPERQVIFSINDLDETLPAPWEWDLKRLAASFMVASRDNHFNESTARDMAVVCVRTYRERMAEFAEMNTIEFWSFTLKLKTIISDIQDPQIRHFATRRLDKEELTGVAEHIFPKLTQSVGDAQFIKEQPPTIFHVPGYSPGQIPEEIKQAFVNYRETLKPEHRVLLDRYEIKDAAIKVVGVGSVGTSCWVILMMDNDNNPLFLQVKEARKSVLEEFAGESEYANAGERVVNGYRLMQPYSDIFLGWTTGKLSKNFYFRQLKDMKISMNVESFRKTQMELYAGWCGYALALSHARTGEASLIRGYTGKSDILDEAIASFSVLYADQNEKDYHEFMKAIRDGKIKTAPEEKK
jgi:uncharacterized protein (DUF2252 family)